MIDLPLPDLSPVSGKTVITKFDGGLFSVTLRGGGKTFFAAFRCALFALDGNARNQAVRRSTGSRAFASGRGIMSLINYTVNGACGFVLWCRPQTRCRDFPHDARLLVSGVFGSEFEVFP